METGASIKRLPGEASKCPPVNEALVRRKLAFQLKRRKGGRIDNWESLKVMEMSTD